MYKSKQTIKIELGKLKPHPKNPKLHNNELIEKSINELGYAENIVIDENNTILAGHGRVKALKKRGDTETEAIQITGWTDEEKEKYMLLANQSTILGGFDNDMLRGFDLAVLGYAEVTLPELHMPTDVQNEPNAYDGFVYVMKIPHDKWNEVEPELENLCNKYGIEANIS